MVPTGVYLLVCKWDLTMRCFPMQENSLTTDHSLTDSVGHLSGFLWNSEVSTGNGWRRCERLSPSAEHTAVRALSLPASLSVSGSYINQCSSCNSKISCASLQEGCGNGAEQDQLWHFGCCRWASKSPGSGIHPLGDTTARASHGTSPYMGAWGFSSEPISSPKGFCSVEYLGPGRSQSGGGKRCCLTVLAVCSSPESFPWLFAFGICLPPRCRPRAGWLCRTPSVARGLLPALSESCSTGSVSPRGKGETIMFLWEQHHCQLPSEACLAPGNECSSTG